MKTKLKLFLLTLLMGAALIATAAEPTLDQVYTATRSGQLAEARTMMQEVLQAHPNSGKAHYVNAEVLAKSGDLATARTEFALAEKLEPGLPSINPRSVQELQQALNGRSGTMAQGSSESSPSISWGTILLIGGLALLLVVWLVRRQARQYPVAAPGQQPGGYYPPGPMPMGQPMQPGGGGMGLMGSLATGAALGAGLVAGEALAHNLMGGSNSGGMPQGGNANSDLGGQDFGVSDSGSWDSGGGGGGDWT